MRRGWPAAETGAAQQSEPIARVTIHRWRNLKGIYESLGLCFTWDQSRRQFVHH